MSDIKISELPVASSVSDADIVVINQGSVTKTATRSLIRGTQNAGTITSITAGTGLTGGTITSSGTIAVNYGTTNTTACVGNDARLSNSRTPTSHASTHATGGTDVITSVALTTGTITTAPSSATDIANKAYADSIGSGVNFHDAADYGTIAVLSPAATYNQPGGATVGVGATLTGATNAVLEVDGVTVAVGKRILVKNQTNQIQNGIYVVTQQGNTTTLPYILTRASDYDTSGSGPNEVQAGDFVLVLNSTLANTAWVQQTQGTIIFGSSNIAFTQFAAAAPGVTSFSAGTTGLSVNQSTGAVTLAGTLDIDNGGTGQTTAQAAITALTGTQTSGQYLRSNGTIASLSAIQAGDVPTLNQNTTGTAGNVTGTVVVSNGGTGASSLTGIVKGNGASAMTAADSGTDYVAGADVSSYRVTVLGSVNITPATGGTTPTQLTFDAGVQPAIDAHTIALGDILLLTGQTDTTTRGPWVVTQVGTVSVGMVLTRPNWFSTTTARSGVLMSVANGTTGQGNTITIYPSSSSDAGIVLGTTGLSTKYVFAKIGLPITSGGTGATTAQAAINTLAGAVTANRVLRGDGTNISLSQVALTTDVSGILPIANGGTGASNASNAKVNLGVQLKESCKYATVAPLPANTATVSALTGTSNGALSVDGVAVSASDRILVKDEANTVNNGIYDVTSAGSVSSVFVLTRSTDANQAFEINVDDIVPITLGAQLANTFWIQKSTIVTIGTSPITFVSSTLGGILPVTKGGTGASDPATARTNLGITGGTPTDVQIFSTTGTWTKPAGAKSVNVQLFGAGGGGGGGRKDSTAATAKVGGAGGGGGSYLNVTFSEAAFGSTENIIVGAGGTSGIAITGTGNGGGGGAGGNTSFGALICPGGTGGGGGTTVAAGAGSGVLNANAGGGSSATVAGSGGFPAGSTSVFMYGGAGGAGGGGVTAAGAATTGGAGGRSSVLNQAGGAFGATGTAGGNGYNNNAAFLNGLFAVGSGGGGGGGGLGAVSGGNGGTGGFPAGGGGGGGATETGTTSGAGGGGGNGLAIITTYF